MVTTGDSLYLGFLKFIGQYGWHLLSAFLVCMFLMSKYRNYEEWKHDNNRFLSEQKKMELDRAREKARQMQHERYLQTVKEKGEAPSITEMEKQRKKERKKYEPLISNTTTYKSNDLSQPARRWGASRRPRGG